MENIPIITKTLVFRRLHFRKSPWWALGNVNDCPAHMYNDAARLEADTYALAISVQSTLDDSKPCDQTSIVAAPHNVSREPRIYANGIPFTSGTHCIRSLA